MSGPFCLRGIHDAGAISSRLIVAIQTHVETRLSSAVSCCLAHPRSQFFKSARLFGECSEVGDRVLIFFLGQRPTERSEAFAIPETDVAASVGYSLRAYPVFFLERNYMFDANALESRQARPKNLSGQ